MGRKSSGGSRSVWVRKGGYQSGKPNSPYRMPPKGSGATKPVSSNNNGSNGAGRK
jgi:hypothetical protein